MHLPQTVAIERQQRAGHLPGCLKIDGLAADHPPWSGRFSDGLNHPELSRGQRGSVARGRRLAGEQRERFRMQTIAGKNRNAVAVDRMQRRPATPQ